ncbi:hypothetical protein IEQ34_007812 [Dendrobium chrysotoxum]|uniref:Uncharacterized protein n=1 Tax=Dendrobium chrysotoxum TaxID=161865 RepID=A0AAV7GN15_DENCH|nr:hypothetical protein IEQ34_007812 [Dendrobium chrysotoxum]
MYLNPALLISINLVTANHLILTVMIFNGANVVKHCVPIVPYQRISITFRKMNKAKLPYNFKLDLDLQIVKLYDIHDAFES